MDIRAHLADLQRRIRLAMRDKTGWSVSRLATEAGVSPSTLNRRVKPGSQGLISVSIWHELSRVSGVPIPPELLNAASIEVVIDEEILERVLEICLDGEVADPAMTAASIARQVAAGYRAFAQYEADGKDDEAAFRMLRELLRGPLVTPATRLKIGG